MTSRQLVRRLRVWLLLLGVAHAVAGQAPGEVADSVYPLHGTLVDGVSGKPVARALVISGDARLAGITDSAGRFQFEIRVPAGAPAISNVDRPNLDSVDDGDGLVLYARKPGYLLLETPQLIHVDAALGATDLELKLMPSGLISGRVTADGEEAAPGVNVTLLQHIVTNDGEWTWSQVGSTNTNSRGEFRFPQLTPGDYTVSSTEWQGEEPLQQQRNIATEEYPPVFCGDAATLAAAMKLHVGYGDAVRADLHLAVATYYPVTIPVEGQATNGPLAAVITHAGSSNGQALSYNVRERTVEGWLPNGHYSVVVLNGGQPQASAAVELNVDGRAVRTKPVALVPGGRIQVRIHNELMKPAAPKPVEPTGRAAGDDLEGAPVGPDGQEQLVAIELRSSDEESTMFGRASRAGGAEGFALESVQPGKYRVNATAFRGYVARVTSGGNDLLQQPLVVTASGRSGPIDVTLRDDSATVTGTVSWEKKNLPFRSAVFFVPEDSNGQFTRTVVGSLGKFSVESLVPGRYRVMAFPNGRALLPYRDAEGMRPFEGKGIEVTAGPNQKLEVNVPLLDQATPEGESFNVEL